MPPTTPEPAVEAGERDPATIMQELATKSRLIVSLRRKIATPGGSNQGTAFALQRLQRERKALWGALPALRLVPSQP